MDFTPTEEQRAASGLAADIFADHSTHERLSALGTGTDPALWKALCAAGLPEAVEDIGLLGLVLVLEEQGRTTAQVPLAATCAYGLLPLLSHGTGEMRARLLPGLRDGTTVVTGAFPLHGQRSPVTAVRRNDENADGSDGGQGWRLTGTVPVVPWLRDATHVLVPARCTADGELRCFLVPASAQTVTTEPVETTAPWAAGRLGLHAAPGEPLADGAYAPTLARARTAFAALQAGVCAGSLARAVEHTCEREQFGRPLSTNQGVQLRAADAHMDTESIRVTVYEAAWRHDQAMPAATHSLTAAWWAAEAGRRVVHAGQHLHGGIGADLGHPVHRHFLWGRQLDTYLGAPGELLAELGDLLAAPETDDSDSGTLLTTEDI